MNFNILDKVFSYKKGVGILLFDFEVNNISDVKEIFDNTRNLVTEMTKLSSKGYVNKSGVDLPILCWFKEKYEIKMGSNSILFNTLFNSFILVLLYNQLLLVEDKFIEMLNKNTDENADKNIHDVNNDLRSDIDVLRRDILKLINPSMKDKISKRGISVVLNAVVGFDSEYELKSSLEKRNDLISTQLAGTAGLVLKIPIIENIDDFNVSDLGPGLLNKNEKQLCGLFCKSLSVLFTKMRLYLHSDNDILITRLTEYVNKMCEDGILKSGEFNGYKMYVFPKSELVTKIKYTDVYSSEDFIKDADLLNNDKHEESLLKIVSILNEINEQDTTKRMLKSIKDSSNKPLSRITYKYNHSKSSLSITVNRILTICMHESAADLSMLSDFDTFKENLDILHRSFVTLGRPLKIDYCKSRVHLRDTVLLSPPGGQSLANLGKIYGDEYKKIDIGDYRSGKMQDLLSKDKDLFERYAIQDSIITWKHATSMEDFNLSINQIGVPLTISSISKNYIVNEWSKMKYAGYQPKSGLSMGNMSTLLSPKGARSESFTSYLIPFLASYRGGRNESYMYGVDEMSTWIDYDLTSCYTTVMSILGDPDYKHAAYLFDKTVKAFSYKDLLFNYIALDVEFKFPMSVKYPCIPTRVDDNIDIYPRYGRSIITGAEYLAAKSMGCKLYVKSGVIIPFRGNGDATDIKREGYDLDYFGPYRDIVKELQRKRRMYPKKSFFNLMFKLVGNSGYGQISMGISGKKAYDVKTNTYISIKGGVLANPILSSYITGFNRALIGECMNNIQKLGGKILSTTTDGFLTDVVDLENKILNLGKENTYCLMLYRKVREYLTSFEGVESDPSALEIKTIEEAGIISLKTRGQLGFTNGGVSAVTGFQTRGIEKSHLINVFSNLVTDDCLDKKIEYIQTGLRSASDIYKKGGHMIATYKDRSYNLEYDNKRCIIEEKDGNKNMLDSKPWNIVSEYEKIRVLKEMISKPVFRNGVTFSQSKGYKSYIETSVRGFIKACLSDKRYGIPVDYFVSYKSIIEFIRLYEPANEVKLSISSISHLKNRNTISRTVPRTPENEGFISFVKSKIPSFNDDLFFKELSAESIKMLKNDKKIS